MPISLEDVKKQLNNCFDLKTRSIFTTSGEVTLLYIDDLCNSAYISLNIINPLLEVTFPITDKNSASNAVHASSVEDVKDANDAIIQILSGNTVLFFPFIDYVMTCDTKKIASRGIEKTEFDPSLRGPKESFNEAFMDSLSLIRKRITSPELKIEVFRLGTKSQTNAALLFMEGTAPEELIQFMRDKLNAIEDEYILSINYIAEQIRTDNSIIETAGYTEKPDTVVSRLFEGRIAVVLNGAPFALTVPYFFIENFQSPDDYYSNKRESSFTRVLRFGAFLVSLLLPGLYVALTTMHYSLLPTTFMFRLAVSRAGVPLPTFVELIVMQLFFELAREAGKRLPQQIGQALSVVAGLILGESAVGVGIASQATVVVTGVYAICSFINPRLIGAGLAWSVVVTIASVSFGLHGFYIAFILFIAQISSLRTCSYPFMFPLGTVKAFKSKAQDIVIRGPLASISKNIFKKK
ncbi:MAG: hypothetical protein K0R90_1077 [Oscillospiraceae bacterium]|jgi:hypothetical protein|nr:hypothetical protein [Oscillospiraceae bacterium]